MIWPPNLGSSATPAPTAAQSHGTAVRGMDLVPGSVLAEGRFGRLFRNLPPAAGPTEQLAALAATTVADPDPRDVEPVPTPEPPDAQENPVIPAGYTYLGQFIDHDITFDPVSSLQRQNDPDGLHDFRTPGLDLDSLYGRGPDDQPYLYRNGPAADPHPALGFDRRGVMLLVGRTPSPGGGATADADLPRNSEGRALLGDPRNDENLVVSQLHLAFLHFHNRMAEHLFESTGLTGTALFEATQRQVRWHYQWVVVNDFLRRVVDGDPGDGSTGRGGVVDDILRPASPAGGSAGQAPAVRPELRFFRWRNGPFMPVEFSVAAYRFGHSMVRPSYFINAFVAKQMSNARIPILSMSTEPLANLNGFRPLPSAWTFDWRLFFELDSASRPQHSYRIDTRIAAPLGSLPDRPDLPSLAHRNLLRGVRLGLPSGESVARAMGVQSLGSADLGLAQRGAPGFDGATPLWFYILREAELLADGERLGPVGGRIVAEVLIGLLAGDQLSWINVDPGWQPPLARNGRFGMPELIRFAFGGQASAPAPDGEGSAIDQWRALFGAAGDSDGGSGGALATWRSKFGEP